MDKFSSVVGSNKKTIELFLIGLILLNFAPYEVLGDPKKRENYDQFGFAGTQGQGFGGGDPFGRTGLSDNSAPPAG